MQRVDILSEQQKQMTICLLFSVVRSLFILCFLPFHATFRFSYKGAPLNGASETFPLSCKFPKTSRDPRPRKSVESYPPHHAPQGGKVYGQHDSRSSIAVLHPGDIPLLPTPESRGELLDGLIRRIEMAAARGSVPNVTLPIP